MIEKRKSSERGHANHGWLETYHTFSFADYYDPKHVHFGVLRVINEDWISAGYGFGTHPHSNMEIITYVIEGELEHKDSMGNSTRILPGEVQRMSAGTGITHSEYNPRNDISTHLLQIWIFPKNKDVVPSYGQKSFTEKLKCNDLVLTASLSGEEDSVGLNQDIKLYVCKSSIEGKKVSTSNERRKYWIQVVKGDVVINNLPLSSGDGAGIVQENSLNIIWSKNSEFLFFDLP